MVQKAVPFDFAACQQQLQELLAQTAVSFTSQQLTQLTTLIEMLHTWNTALNLTSIKEVKQMVLLHVVDSAVLVPVLRDLSISVHSVADVGTGAGFPGLVLAILCPDLQLTLIDSVGKKLSFVRQVVSKLQLDNVELINKRCEDIKHKPFDCIVSRAFAPLERMVNWCLPLLTTQGRFVAMKANLATEEIQAIPRTVIIESIAELQVPTLDAKRQAVILQRA